MHIYFIFIFQLGGYPLPFLCLGLSVIMCVIVNIFLIPLEGEKITGHDDGLFITPHAVVSLKEYYEIVGE